MTDFHMTVIMSEQTIGDNVPCILTFIFVAHTKFSRDLLNKLTLLLMEQMAILKIAINIPAHELNRLSPISCGDVGENGLLCLLTSSLENDLIVNRNVGFSLKNEVHSVIIIVRPKSLIVLFSSD